MLQLDARGDLDDIVSTKLAGSILHASPERILEAIDLAEQTRLGIPLLTADDCIHGHSFWPGATIFPTQLGMACTWDPELVEQAARVTAVEVAATGLHWTFSPVLCIARDLRWGRVGETFGEDPHLIGELGAAMIRGYQGDGLTDPTAVLACAKHFAGYSETQGGRDASEADLSRRKLTLVVPAALRAGGPGGLSHLHARLPGHRRRPGHRQPVAARRGAQGGVGLHRHARHRLGQRRPHGLGAAGLCRRRRGRDRRGARGQRPRHDDARAFFEAAQEAVARRPARRAPGRRGRPPRSCD